MRRLSLRIVVAVAAVLPLIGPLVWEPGSPRLALQSGVVLASVSAIEQPLTIRSLVGAWLMLVLVGWFAAVYLARHRQRIAVWEVALVLCGAALAVIRLGNVWVTAVLIAPALVRRAALVKPAWLLSVAGGCLLAVGAASLLASRPAPLPADALRSVEANSGPGDVFAYWRWSNTLEHDLGPRRPVLGAGDLLATSENGWTDYLRVSLGHEHWADVLRAEQVDLVVLDTASQSLTADLVRASSEWQVLFDGQGALVARRVAA